MNIFDSKGNVPVESIVDPNTGETIHRVAIDQKHIDEIQKTINAHQQNMNNFLTFSQQFFLGVKHGMDLIEKTTLADKAIKETLNNITKKTKLDQKKPWSFNLVLKTFEYRTPPIVQGMPGIEKPEIK